MFIALAWLMASVTFSIFYTFAMRDFLISEPGGAIVFWVAVTFLLVMVILTGLVINWFWHNPDLNIIKIVITDPDDPRLYGLSEPDRRAIIKEAADEIAILRFFREKELEESSWRFLRDTQRLIQEKENVLRAVGVENIEAEIGKSTESFKSLSKDDRLRKGMVLFWAERWFQPILPIG